jgi:hypothetical protein
MTAAQDTIDAAIAAARSRDLDTLRALVDWPLSGAADMASALPNVDERDRAAGAASGLRELMEAERDTSLIAEFLLPVAVKLVEATQVRPADPAVRDAAVAAIQVPPLPSGLTPDQIATFDQLRARAARVSDVYVVSGAAGEAIVLWTADTGRLVLPPE